MSAAEITPDRNYAVVTGSFTQGLNIECLEQEAAATLKATCFRALGMLAQAVEVQRPSSLGSGTRDDLTGDHIIAFSGAPGSGLSLYGPFADFDRAERVAEHYRSEGEEWGIWKAECPTHPLVTAKPGTEAARLFLLQAAVASQKQHAEAMSALARALIGPKVTRVQANVIARAVEKLASELTAPRDVLTAVAPTHVQTLVGHIANGYWSQAFQISEGDVAKVLNTAQEQPCGRFAGMSYEAMAEALLPSLDLRLIEEQALYGDSLDRQTSYAHEEIARQLGDLGVLEPMRAAHPAERQ